jgi:hypothetical protein
VRLDRRKLFWISVTQNSTAEWIACQLTEGFPWDSAPRYLIRDHDRIYGEFAQRRIRAMGIRDKPIALASPWQNGFAERLIDSIRRECLDHLVILSEAHLRSCKGMLAITTRSGCLVARGLRPFWGKLRPRRRPSSLAAMIST